MQGVREAGARYEIPLLPSGFGAAFCVHFTSPTELRHYRDVLDDNRELLGRFLFEMLREGINMVPDGRFYSSIAHTDADVDQTIAAVDRVHDRLLERIPDQGPATIVHGDYRLDNCMVDDSGEVVAVLDWEICTLGDPLADLGLLQVYWTGPDDADSAWTGSATTPTGFWNRGQLAERYAAVSGRDIGQLDFYVAFAYWKLACILEGVYSRYLGGALGEQDPAALEAFRLQVDNAAASAAQRLEELG